MQRNIAMSISQQLFQIPNKESLGVTQVGSSLRKINCEQSLAMWLKGTSSIVPPFKNNLVEVAGIRYSELTRSIPE
jgi:hypothetical protein